MEEKNIGWIKSPRQFKEWRWYKKPYMFHLFHHLIFSANRNPVKWEGIPIKRGQLITGLSALHENTGISTQSLRTCLKKLKSTGEITIKSTNKYSIITICNYDRYQPEEINTNNQINKLTNKELTNNQQTTNNKQEYKEVEEDIKEKNKKENFSISEIPKKEEEKIPLFLQDIESPYKKFFDENPDFQP